jgi:Tol biopolymer transport system component
VSVIGARKMRRRLWAACAVGGCITLGGIGGLSALGQTPKVAPLSGSSELTYITPASGTAKSPVVMLAAANGSEARALGPGSTAVLSPNGRFVAAVTVKSSQAANQSSLVLYSASGKTGPKTLRQSNEPLTLVGWSPDSSEIAVTDGDSLVIVRLSGVARVVASGTITGASFAPDTPDRLVYASAASLLVSSKVDLYVVSAAGGTPLRITSDGLSEYPLWGPNGIIFSHEYSSANPAYQLWFINPRTDGEQALTDLTMPDGFTGLEPIAISKDGEHLLANLNAPDTSEAWVLNLGAARPLPRDLSAPGIATVGNAISHDGSTILLTDGYGSPADADAAAQSVEAVQWNGVKWTVLARRGAFASWTR